MQSPHVISAAAHWDVPARPDQISVLRHRAAAFAAEAGMLDRQLDDVRTAVSEAVTNVVLHAYDPRVRRHWGMQMDLEIVASQLVVRVRDQGAGLRSRRGGGRKGIGLRVIATLADSFEMRCDGGGTEVRMRFGLSGNGSSGGGADAVRHS